MVFGKLGSVFTFMVQVFLTWCLLTTMIPQYFSEFQLNKIPTKLYNKNIQLLIAHPDDEVMFFAPTLTELSKDKYNNHVSVLCYSTGNDTGLGDIRKLEIVRSLQILGINNVTVLNDETKFKDSMQLVWKGEDILEYVDPEADVLLTFDEGGVSNHPNHKSLFDAVKDSGRPLLSLKTWNTFVKYSSMVVTNMELIYDYVCINPNIKEQLPNIKSMDELYIYSDLPSSILGTAAMAYGHNSQMIWFRWGWLAFSRYGNTNQLKKYNF